MLAVLMLSRMTVSNRIERKQKTLIVERIPKKTANLDYCRTCLNTNDLVDIFHDKYSIEKRSSDLKLVTGLDIKSDDLLSQKICPRCVQTINMALQFRRTCRKAEKSLTNIAQGNTKRKRNISKSLKAPRVKKRKSSELDMAYGYDCYDNDYQDDFNGDDDYVAVDVKDECRREKQERKIKPMLKQAKKREKFMSIATSAPYKCTICNKEYRMKATYKAHMRFHTNYRICEACGKRCRNNIQLAEHKRARHGLGKIHKCAYCAYSSATKEALIIHERRHTGERPYICDHCGTTFHRRSNLVQHIAIHLPDKNFQCDMCPKKLKSRKFLQIHKHNVHTGKRYGYLCPICDHRFEKPNKARAHTRRVHGIPDEQQGPICEICQKWEKSKKLLKTHQFKTHRGSKYRYVCPICQVTFTRPGSVRHHLTRSHGVSREDQGIIDKIQISVPGVQSTDIFQDIGQYIQIYS